MANIRKTFNFRNGVQVDEQNLIVNSLGLVGIGTSIPTQLLDVNGNAKVAGFLTSTTLYSKNLISANITAPSAVLGLLSISSTGILQATSGIITYYGDGSQLTNLPPAPSQWSNTQSLNGVYINRRVGVFTDTPIFTLQVGGSNTLNNFSSGVGISSDGHMYVTGIITSLGKIIGSDFTGNGQNLIQLNASNISSGVIGTSYLPTIANSKLPSNIIVSGIITAQSGFSGQLTGNVSGNLTGSVTGNVTGNLTGNVVGVLTGTVFGNLVGIASTASSILPTSNITLNNLVSTGITTVTNLVANGKIGINTNSAQADLHVVNSSSATIRITSPNTSALFIGKSVTGEINGSLRYNFNNQLNPYSLENSFDIINYSQGNVNNYIHLGNLSGLGTGNFNWLYGKNPLSPLMTLTYRGNLGLGITNPTETLSVVGTSTITSNFFVGNNAFIKNNLNVDGDLTVVGSVNLSSSSVTVDELTANTIQGNLVGNVSNGNITATTGSSSFNAISVATTANVGKIAVNTFSIENSNAVFQINSGQNASVFTSSSVGIGTTSPRLGFDVLSLTSGFYQVGIGTDSLRCSADFADAGRGVASGTKRFMLPPRLTSAEVTVLNNAGNLNNMKGAIIYNETTNKHQGYGSTDGGSTFGWFDLY